MKGRRDYERSALPDSIVLLHTFDAGTIKTKEYERLTSSSAFRPRDNMKAYHILGNHAQFILFPAQEPQSIEKPGETVKACQDGL